MCVIEDLKFSFFGVEDLQIQILSKKCQYIPMQKLLPEDTRQMLGIHSSVHLSSLCRMAP